MNDQQLKKNYWNAIGNRNGYFTRKKIMPLLIMSSIPIISPLAIITAFVYRYYIKKEWKHIIPEKYLIHEKTK